jgi:hypothetical protein
VALMRAQQQQAQAEAAAATQQAQADDGVALWDAVAQDAQGTMKSEQAPSQGQALYRCPHDDGTEVVTTTPKPGCIYLGIGN